MGILCAGNMAAAAEAMAFADTVGLDKKKVLAAVTKGAGNSWYLDNRGDTMCNGKYDFEFAIKHLQKDINIVLDESTSQGMLTPVTDLSSFLFDFASTFEGLEGEDISAVYKTYPWMDEHWHAFLEEAQASDAAMDEAESEQKDAKK